MSSAAFCIICGTKEDEVSRMHYFPSVLERSKIWQESMGMKYVGTTRRNFRICCRHFSPESYTNSVDYKLLRKAVPTLFPCTQVAATVVGDISGYGTAITPDVETHCVSPINLNLRASRHTVVTDGRIQKSSVAEHIFKNDHVVEISNLKLAAMNPYNVRFSENGKFSIIKNVVLKKGNIRWQHCRTRI